VSAHIKETLKSDGKSQEGDKHFDKLIKPLTVKDFRNAFYKIYNVGGSETGLRRFINPEFRRPLIARLSHAAGQASREALPKLAKDL
jgi:hypothetical protein